MSETICKDSKTGINNMLIATNNYFLIHLDKLPWVMAMWFSRFKANGAY